MATETELERMVVRLIGDVGNYVESLEHSRKSTEALTESVRSQQSLMTRGNALTRELMTVKERETTKMREAKQLLDRGAISQETYDRALTRSNEAIKAQGEAGEHSAKGMHMNHRGVFMISRSLEHMAELKGPEQMLQSLGHMSHAVGHMLGGFGMFAAMGVGMAFMAIQKLNHEFRDRSTEAANKGFGAWVAGTQTMNEALANVQSDSFKTKVKEIVENMNPDSPLGKAWQDWKMAIKHPLMFDELIAGKSDKSLYAEYTAQDIEKAIKEAEKAKAKMQQMAETPEGKKAASQAAAFSAGEFIAKEAERQEATRKTIGVSKELNDIVKEKMKLEKLPGPDSDAKIDELNQLGKGAIGIRIGEMEEENKQKLVAASLTERQAKYQKMYEEAEKAGVHGTGASLNAARERETENAAQTMLVTLKKTGETVGMTKDQIELYNFALEELDPATLETVKAQVKITEGLSNARPFAKNLSKEIEALGISSAEMAARQLEAAGKMEDAAKVRADAMTKLTFDLQTGFQKAAAGALMSSEEFKVYEQSLTNKIAPAVLENMYNQARQTEWNVKAGRSWKELKDANEAYGVSATELAARHVELVNPMLAVELRCQQAIKDTTELVEAQNEHAASIAGATKSQMAYLAAIKTGNQQQAYRKSLIQEGTRLFEETRNPLEKYAQKHREVSELLKAGTIDQQVYNRAMAAAEKQLNGVSQALQGVQAGSAEALSHVLAYQEDLTRGANVPKPLEGRAAASFGGAEAVGRLGEQESLKVQQKMLEQLEKLNGKKSIDTAPAGLGGGGP